MIIFSRQLLEIPAILRLRLVDPYNIVAYYCLLLRCAIVAAN